MSLIADALKTAQREKQRRESGAAARPPVPVLVPLRTPIEPEFSWRRSLLLGGSGAAVLAVAWLGMRALKPTGPAPVRQAAIVSEIPPAMPFDSATPPSSVSASRVNPPVEDGGAQRSETAAPIPARTAGVRASKTRPKPALPPAVIPQAQTRTVSTPAVAAPRSEGLHIAVEQPRAASAERLFAAGVAAHRAGDLTTARALYEQVLAMRPNDPDVLNNLGVLLSGLREYDRAEALLRRAIALAPANAGAWNNLGSVLRERGMSGDAIAAFQRALAIDPQHQGARVSLAQQYLALGSLGQARALLDQVLAANPAVPEAQYALGQVLEQQGDTAAAIQAYQAFVRVAPARFAAHVERVRRHIDALGSSR